MNGKHERQRQWKPTRISGHDLLRRALLAVAVVVLASGGAGSGGALEAQEGATGGRRQLRRSWEDDRAGRIIQLGRSRPASNGRELLRKSREEDAALAINRARRPEAPRNAPFGANPAVNAAAAAGLGQAAPQPAPGTPQVPPEGGDPAAPAAGGAQDNAGAAQPGAAQAVPGAQAGDEVILPRRPNLRNLPVTIDAGKIPLRDFLVFLADFTGLPILVETDQQLLSKEIEVVAPLKNINGEVVKALLETNKIRLYSEKIPDPAAPDDPLRATEVLKVENMAPTTPTGRDPKPIVIVQVDEIDQIEGEIDPDQYATMVFELDHVAPKDAIDALNDLVSGTTTARGGTQAGRRGSSSFSMVEVNNTQKLIITAKFGLLNYLQQLLRLIDVPFPEPERIVKIIQVEWADSTELANTMNEFIQGRQRGLAGRFGTSGQRQVTARTPTTTPSSTSTITGQQTDFSTKLIPDLRTNKIIIETYLLHDLQDIEMLLGELDIRYENRRLRTNIYQVRYLKAIEVAQDLQLLIEGSGQAGLSRTTRGTTRGTTRTTGVPRVSTRTPAATGQAGGAAQNEPLPSLIVPHEPTNSLMIQAEPEDFDEILNILSKIDAKRRQVFLEAALVQVQSGSSLNYAIELIAGNPDDDAMRFLGASNFGLTSIDVDTFTRVFDLTQPPIGGLGAIMNNGEFPAIITFFKNNSDSQILATPFILADDNEENRIDILETRFVTNTSVQQNQTTLQQQTGEPAGISLAITPTISGSEKAVFLTMDLSVSAFQGQGTATTLPPKAENTVTSSVTVPDGKLFVIGGLTRENSSKTVDKVPILGDIPILGKLFRSESVDQSQNNLYVFLQAHILTDEEFRDGIDLTRQAQDQMMAFDPDIKTTKFDRPDAPRERSTLFPESDDLDGRRFSVNPGAEGGLGRRPEDGRGAYGASGTDRRTDYNSGTGAAGAGAAPSVPATTGPSAPVATPGTGPTPGTAPGTAPGTLAPGDVAPQQPAVPARPPRKLKGWFE